MPFLKRLLATGFVVLSMLIHGGVGLKCYNCSSWECRYSDKLNKTWIIDCENSPCLKLLPQLTGGQSEIIQRGCYNESLCTDYSVCYKCDTGNYCNTSTHISPSLPYFPVIIVSLIYVYLCVY